MLTGGTCGKTQHYGRDKVLYTRISLAGSHRTHGERSGDEAYVGTPCGRRPVGRLKYGQKDMVTKDLYMLRKSINLQEAAQSNVSDITFQVLKVKRRW